LTFGLLLSHGGVLDAITSSEQSNPFAWLETPMGETEDEPVQLTDDQKRYFQTIFDHFERDGAWPTFAQIERVLDRSWNLDAEEIARSVSQTIVGGGHLPWTQPDAVVKLPLRIAAMCNGSEYLLRLMVATVGLAYKTWREAGDLRITSKQLHDDWRVPEPDLLRLGLLVLQL
jgi:hypothetical protein